MPIDPVLPPLDWTQPQDAGRDTVASALRFYYDAYEAYDSVLFPLTYATGLGETNPVAVLRISPIDATSPTEIEAERRELLGMRLNHFGAFLNESWRSHDIVWGRLNASECLIRGLLPPAHPEIEPLIRKAHESIINEYAETHERDPSQTSWDWFVNYRPPALDNQATSEVVNRMAGILARLGSALIRQRSREPDPQPSKLLKAWNALTRLLSLQRSNLAALRGALKEFLPAPLLSTTLVITLIALAGVAGIIWQDGVIRYLGTAMIGFSIALAAVAIGLVALGLWGVRKLRETVWERVEKLLKELNKPT